jgi:hypothetical protein
MGLGDMGLGDMGLGDMGSRSGRFFLQLPAFTLLVFACR